MRGFTLPTAALAMAFSSLSVTGNSLRLRRVPLGGGHTNRGVETPAAITP